MSKQELLPFNEPIISFDIVEVMKHDLWFFMTKKNLYVRKVTMADRRPILHEQLSVACFPGMESDSKLNCTKMLVVATDLDIHCLFATSVYHLIKISMKTLEPVILKSLLAPVSELLHVKECFAISCSEDNSINGWDLEKGNLVFKYNFLYFNPTSVISGVNSSLLDNHTFAKQGYFWFG